MKAHDLIKVLDEAKQIIPQDLTEMAATSGGGLGFTKFAGRGSNNGMKRALKGNAGPPTKKRFDDPYAMSNGAPPPPPQWSPSSEINGDGSYARW